MKTFIAILIVVLLLSLHSCKEKDRSAERVAQLNPTDKFLIDIPIYKGKVASYFWLSKKYYDSSLRLQYLGEGFDSIQIRIWYGSTFTEERLVSLINKDKKWSAEISKVSSYANPTYKGKSFPLQLSYKQYIPTRTIEYKNPKSGWDNLIEKLFRLDLLILADEQKVAGMNTGDVADGWGVTVEIATKKTYRLFRYSNPDIYFKESEEARKINKILLLLDEEFGLNKIGDYIDQIPKKKIKPNTAKKVEMKEMKIQEIK